MTKTKKKKGLGKLFAGLAIGGALGVLFAPKKGSETRKALKNRIEDFIEKVKEIDKEEVKKNFYEKVEKVTEELKDLDKEKALKLAKKKAKDLKDSCEDLLAYAKEKGTPVLEKAAEEVREKAIEVTKEVLKKLEAK